jgi:hypothetical protein
MGENASATQKVTPHSVSQQAANDGVCGDTVE